MEQAQILFLGEKTDFYLEVAETLLAKNIEVSRFTDMENALSDIVSNPPHVLIAEAPKEGVSGLALCQEVRSHFAGLFILVSVQERIDFHILALDLGVDGSYRISDGAQFTVANVLALLKRYISLRPVKQFTFGSMTIDSSKRDVFIGGQAVDLSTIEFQLIWSLAKRHGNVVSRDEIHHELYKCPYNGYDRTIDLYISRIRQKIGDTPGASQYLKTVRGIGYQFIPVDDTQQATISS